VAPRRPAGKKGKSPVIRPIQGYPPAVQLIGIGWYVALCIVLGVVGGVLLDKWAGTRPAFTLAGLALGLVMAFWGGWLQLKEVLDNIETRRRGEKP
jgi:F0F1-type ATP synthase assembly protein I